MDEIRLLSWLKADDFRMECLATASRLQLKNWCIAAGFLRNLSWDKLHGYTQSTMLEDIDLIYFNPDKLEKDYDRELESKLPTFKSGPKWSVKNQARMNFRNRHPEYSDLIDAMGFWPETCTSVGVFLSSRSLKLISAYGFQDLFDLKICKSPMTTLNEKQLFDRIRNKNWLQKWPLLTIDFPSPPSLQRQEKY